MDIKIKECHKRYLILENGQFFEGFSFGADKVITGELVFTTGMCGYIETLTDPSYYGQIVLQTFPMIGNYGIIEEDFEGKCSVSAYVVREYCDNPSNFRCNYTLDSFLKNEGVPGIFGVDTRQITKIIRENGVMNAMISDTPPTAETLAGIAAYRITDAVKHVSSLNTQTFNASVNPRFKVALIDYGAKHNIIRELNKRGCDVEEFSYNTTADEILAAKPDGLMLSNGPGDPACNTECINQLSALFGKLPIFGICLGHQLLALASGGKTVKLKYGHRGANQPVKDATTGRTYITSQNHGYAVVSDSVLHGNIRFINANDYTCEGIEYPGKHAFSVQFHPEACSGPNDTAFLFDEFVTMMEDFLNVAR